MILRSVVLILIDYFLQYFFFYINEKLSVNYPIRNLPSSRLFTRVILILLKSTLSVPDSGFSQVLALKKTKYQNKFYMDDIFTIVTVQGRALANSRLGFMIFSIPPYI